LSGKSKMTSKSERQVHARNVRGGKHYRKNTAQKNSAETRNITGKPPQERRGKKKKSMAIS